MCIVCLLLAITGCVQPVGIQPSEEREVFVKCVLMNDTVQAVTLLYSGPMVAERFEPVETAEVFITGPEKARIVFQPAGDGRWENGFHPQKGGEYTLHVQIPGRKEITATTRFPEEYAIRSRADAPLRWICDYYAILKHDLPGYAFCLLPNWMGSIRRYIPGWEDERADHSSEIDFQVLEHVAQHGGTTLQREMPGICFWLEASSSVRLYVLGTVTDSSGVVSRMTRLGTNHIGVDRNNLLPDVLEPGVITSPSDTMLVINPDDYDIRTGRGNYLSLSFHNQHVYDLAIRDAYAGQPLYADYLRIDARVDYDNGLKIYSILGEESDATEEDRNAWVDPPFLYPAQDSPQGYYLHLFPDARRCFSIYGDFSYYLWGKHPMVAHPSLYFCSVSEEYDQYLQCTRQQSVEVDLLSALYSNSLSDYSNVQNAYGVFGAMLVLRHDLDVDGLHYYSSGGKYSYPNTYPAYPAPLPEL